MLQPGAVSACWPTGGSSRPLAVADDRQAARSPPPPRSSRTVMSCSAKCPGTTRPAAAQGCRPLRRAAKPDDGHAAWPRRTVNREHSEVAFIRRQPKVRRQPDAFRAPCCVPCHTSVILSGRSSGARHVHSRLPGDRSIRVLHESVSSCGVGDAWLGRLTCACVKHTRNKVRYSWRCMGMSRNGLLFQNIMISAARNMPLGAKQSGDSSWTSRRKAPQSCISNCANGHEPDPGLQAF